MSFGHLQLDVEKFHDIVHKNHYMKFVAFGDLCALMALETIFLL